MLSPRIRRLKLDHDSLFKRFSGWPVIRIVGTAGMPPELYRFQYSIRGLYVAPDGAILERNDHLLEVNLSLGYPRRAPQCRMLTPVFHPNFDDAVRTQAVLEAVETSAAAKNWIKLQAN